MRYRCVDNTQLYISIPGELSDAMNVLSQCIEAVEVWMENNRLQLNYGFFLKNTPFTIIDKKNEVLSFIPKDSG